MMFFFHHPVAWLVCLAWVVRTVGVTRGLPLVRDLLEGPFDEVPSETVTVIVPARNEERDVTATVESLLSQDYAGVRVVAVDDRSSDGTGSALDAVAAKNPDRVRVIHVTELPPNWLGKTHAMAIGAAQVTSDFILFTDADVLFHPTALRLAVAEAVRTQADHLVLVPTTIIRRWDEAGLLAFFQIFGMWGVRPWKVSDPKARDAVGVGAFNMVRREAYLKIGGFEALAMQIVEDLALARRVKRAGLRQRVVFGRGLVSLHWAAGVPGLINVWTKNVFAALNFHATLVLGGCLWLLAFCILPFCLVWIPGYTVPAVIVIGCMAWWYHVLSSKSGLSTWNVLLAPFAAALFGFTLLRSMMTTLVHGGVTWRGTFYPLKTLKKHLDPLR